MTITPSLNKKSKWVDPIVVVIPSLRIGHFRVAFASVSKQVLVHNLPYGNEFFYLQDNERARKKLTSIWKVVYQDSFWNRGKIQLRNGLLNWLSRPISWEAGLLDTLSLTARVSFKSSRQLCDDTPLKWKLLSGTFIYAVQLLALP